MPTFLDHRKSKRIPEKTSTTASLTMPKPLTVWSGPGEQPCREIPHPAPAGFRGSQGDPTGQHVTSQTTASQTPLLSVPTAPALHKLHPLSPVSSSQPPFKPLVYPLLAHLSHGLYKAGADAAFSLFTHLPGLPSYPPWTNPCLSPGCQRLCILWAFFHR